MKKFCLVFCTLFLWHLPAAHALSSHAHSSIETRVYIAAHQSALGHRMVRAMCFVAAGIDPHDNTEIILETRDEMEDGILSMMNGGGKYQLAAEDDWTTRTMYKGLANAWKGLRSGSDTFLENKTIDLDELYTLSVKAKSVQKMWTNILNRTERRLANAEDNSRQNVIRLAHAAGAQEAHLQEAGKLACMLFLDQHHEQAEQSREFLTAAVSEFDTSAFALTFSSADLGFVPPPSDEIQQENFSNWVVWNTMYQIFQNFSQIHRETNKDELALRNLSFDIESMARNLSITSEHYRDFLIAQAFSSTGFSFN